jgi:hypothetical protein
MINRSIDELPRRAVPASDGAMAIGPGNWSTVAALRRKQVIV